MMFYKYQDDCKPIQSEKSNQLSKFFVSSNKQTNLSCTCNWTTFYNFSTKGDVEFLNNFNFNSKSLATVDVIIRNTFPILYYQMLLIFDYFKVLPQYINNYQIIQKVLYFITRANDPDLM